MATFNILSKNTINTFFEKHITLINGVVRRVKENEDRGIIHHDQDVRNLKMVVFTDSSFANNQDYTTQLGYMILLADGTGRENFLHL